EVADAYDVFAAAGFDVDYVSPEGGHVPVYGQSNGSPAQAFASNEERMGELNQSLRPDEVDAARYEAIYYAGGHGVMWDFPENAELARIASSIYSAGGIVSAVCHGPAGLVNVLDETGAPLVSGKRIAAFTNDEERAVGHAEDVPFLLQSRLEGLGANVVTAPNQEANVQVDGRLITGQNPASATGVAERVVALL
ncbi:MAG: putative intracellular protease/amidase, partial [Polyangiales bacterium]